MIIPNPKTSNIIPMKSNKIRIINPRLCDVVSREFILAKAPDIEYFFKIDQSLLKAAGSRYFKLRILFSDDFGLKLNNSISFELHKLHKYWKSISMDGKS